MLWGIWAIGLVVAVLFGQIVPYLNRRGVNLGKPSVSIILHLITIFCIIVVGGMQCGAWLVFLSHCCVYNNDILNLVIYVLIGILIPMLCTFEFGSFVMQLFKCFPSDKSISVFTIVFIVSTICWVFPMHNYYNNFETYTETSSSTEEREIICFYNIPLQNISGYVEGSSNILSGHVEGSISTTDTLPYWYLSEENKLLYDSAPASNSSISFISEGETPYLEIISRQNLTISINHNKETKKIIDSSEIIKEYVFHLPEEIMQY